MLVAPLKWHGGKHYLASRLVKMMPAHTHYVEPFAGGLAVLLAKNPDGISEVVNDLDGQLTNFWRVLQDGDRFEKFQRIVETVPFSQSEWERAHDHVHGQDSVADAVAFFVDCRQSLAGRRTCFAPLSKTRTRRGMNEQASAWLSVVEGLPQVHNRLKRVAILKCQALQLIRGKDSDRTLFYLDPPYLPETRAAVGIYQIEMTEAHHVELLEEVRRCRAKILLSGYPSKLYDRMLSGWNRRIFAIANHAAGGKTKRRMSECVWWNY